MGEYQVTDRRPIKARDLPFFNHLAKKLADKGASANAISVAGTVCAIIAGAALALTRVTPNPWARLLWICGGIGAQLRLQANLLDGMVAIAGGKASAVGELFNEVPDRISDPAIFIGLGYAAGAMPWLGWLAALLAVLTAYVRVLGKIGCGWFGFLRADGQAASDVCGDGALCYLRTFAGGVAHLAAGECGTGNHLCRKLFHRVAQARAYRENIEEGRMTAATHERLFGIRNAFDSGLVLGLTIAIVSILIATPIAYRLLDRAGKLNEKLRKDLWDRYISWLILAPLIVGPILLGAFASMIAVCGLSLLCYREFARATGLFRERVISLVVVIGILAVTYACIDNWYGFFAALSPLTVGVISVITIVFDQPKGFIQRVGLGVLAFMLFGICYGHLCFFCNDLRYRTILCWLLLCVELNDVFAYICGKSFGHIKLAPNTSPNKTVGGALGALVLTAILVAVLAHLVFAGTVVAEWQHALVLGIMISVLGQLGDLLMSSVKRDLGIKDMAATLPGHGGVLDRFNSLLLVCPAVFHYVGYYLGVGLGSEVRIFSNGFFR